MLILGDMSGIQDFLFDVPEEGGGQARQLRARSFRIQLLAECAALRLLRALNLGLDSLILCTAGKFALSGPGLKDATCLVKQEVAEIERWLLDFGRGQLRLSVVVEPEVGSQAAQYARALGALQRAKLSTWQTIAVAGDRWRSQCLVLTGAADRAQQAGQDKDIGRDLPSAHWALFGTSPDKGGGETYECAGMHVGLRQNLPAQASPDLVAIASLRGDALPAHLPTALTIRRRLARHIPVHPNGSPVEFVDLAARAAGAPLLGVLKADVDSLGLAIAQRLNEAQDLRPLQQFSHALEDFFSAALDDDLRDKWPNLYTVFSGGDDLMLVGPWNLVVDFAGHLCQEFARRFSSEGLTLSAGISFIKPKKPIRSAAAQAEDLLQQAKNVPAAGHTAAKDQIACLGEIWKWREHDAVLAAAKRLTGWVQTGLIPRTSLHTLLELALIRRGELPGPQRIPPAMATSRLAYHVARNFPKPDSTQPARREARQWADGLVQEFDRFASSRDAQTIHLPAVIRYALLATRKESDHE